MKDRPDWDTYFMSIAHLVSTRSTCLRRQVGAVMVRDKQILTTGYNGVPRGITHCTPENCLRSVKDIPSGQQQELCRGLHAEQNAIIQAALHGVSTKDATLYCTHKPCILCAKMLINAGVVRIVYQDFYPDPLADEMLEEAGIEMCIWEGRVISR
ncbi:MAG TPA: cytidine/deoxycytidylate deaminase family protein [Candidatus Atribacteria bacterium]|jgi:dCMP deaminase|uniref:deoxycytidylate deaminase n=1 Tax=Candidatus Sordicultor fermentans TaxID=1953203 RepID=UPI0016B6140B|nr:cytidine/deoxycytidylate deaminase family protein [Atribacterota bacterium]NLY06001.1 cytidine deaminase [Candidatus Atribacteria bacterium]MDI9608291.1 cytidine/deoxycytidylate deaminase family protein [Atribacterota bacterium]MDY0135455.1 cytidine/deoxycytidylate deaminase family protein [Atribacterota bacterium]HOA98473.1 cytidine/deoxycytidylate deaminase family protein [Candidatus Atribacteria bacterium]